MLLLHELPDEIIFDYLEDQCFGLIGSILGESPEEEVKRFPIQMSKMFVKHFPVLDFSFHNLLRIKDKHADITKNIADTGHVFLKVLFLRAYHVARKW